MLGYNVLRGFQPLGPGSNVQGLEDFLVSNNLLPLGSLVYLLFCVSKNGWGWDNFMAEANSGNGWKFPKKLRWYMTWVLPIIVVVIYLKGYYDMFSPHGPKYLIPWMCVAFAFLAVIAWFAFGKKKAKN